jgi:tripartite-type tricarboxylate transporter receptor subunit TctC
MMLTIIWLARQVRFALATAASAIALSSVANAQSVEDFYKGKSIDLYIGFSAGGGYDWYARLMARHMPRYIPGNPNIVPKQMKGAGTRIAAKYMMNVAPRDGTALSAIAQGLALNQVMGDPRLGIDVTKFIYIGNANEDNNVVSVWHTAGVQTIEDAKKKEVPLGTTGSASSSQYPIVLNEFVGTKFKLIFGYPGGNDINLAMEKGEVAGRGSNAWASWKATRPNWVRDGKLVHLVQIGLKKAKGLENVPLLMNLAKNEQDKQALRLLSAPTAVGRPLNTTPDVPADRVKALRAAFDKAVKSKELLAEAEKAKFPVNPASGDEVQKLVEEIANSDKDIARRLAVITNQPWLKKKQQKK